MKKLVLNGHCNGIFIFDCFQCHKIIYLTTAVSKVFR